MNSLRFLFDRQVRYFGAAVVLVLATFMPVLASAAQITERSIALSSSTKSATGVVYEIEFTADSALDEGAVVIDFCSNSPLIGQTCTPPTGLSLTAATVSAGWTKAAASTASKLVLEGDIEADVNTVTVTGVTNPSAAGSMYARILTYAVPATAAAYTAATPGAYTDDGSVAISITEGIGVSGAVLESLVFCVANKTIAANCAGIDAEEDAPIVALGEDMGEGEPTVLQANQLYTGSVFAQLSTNAAGGAIVNLKSSASCGGLVRAGTNVCDIAPAGSAGTVDATTNSGKFGLTVADATDVGASAFGLLDRLGSYSATNYTLNFVDATEGISSPYGDPLLGTNNVPASNKQVEITFGVAANNSTPAGLYSADLSLIATGKF